MAYEGGMMRDGILGATLRENEEKTFFDIPVVQQAQKDFKYLCEQTNFMTRTKLHAITLLTQLKEVGDFVVVPYDVASEMVTIPKQYVSPEDANQKLAVVCYENGAVKTVLVYDSSNFAKTGLFSKFKNLKDTGEYGIKLKGAVDKLIPTDSFGIVLKEYIK